MLEWKLWAYKGNNHRSYARPNNTFDSNFSDITASDPNNYSATTDLYPGEFHLYALEISGLKTTKDLYVDITKIISNNIAEKKGNASYHRYARETSGGTTYEVNIGSAMNIYTSYYSAKRNYSDIIASFDADSDGDLEEHDKFTMTNATASTVLAADTIEGKVRTLNSAVRIANIGNSNISTTTLFVYYQIVFSNHDNHNYKETNAGGTVDEKATKADSTSSARYFLKAAKNSGGNSNCYAGLQFQINTLNISQSA